MAIFELWPTEQKIIHYLKTNKLKYLQDALCKINNIYKL